MALVKSGIAKGFSGKVGNIIFSQQKNGTTTVREKPETIEKPATLKQLSSRQDMAVCNAFLKPLKSFILTGYALQAEQEKGNQHNSMVSYLMLNALTGEYPDRRIDFSKVLVTKGKMQQPEDAAVNLNESGFSFSWNPKTTDDLHYSDQIMMLAYFPELQRAEFRTAGAQRHQGKDLLFLSGIKKGYIAEVYISFITDDRKGISDSVYLGQLTW
ncbi:MAG TPA: DUF6266 family protein [Pedobacter sp.]